MPGIAHYVLSRRWQRQHRMLLCLKKLDQKYTMMHEALATIGKKDQFFGIQVFAQVPKEVNNSLGRTKSGYPLTMLVG